MQPKMNIFRCAYLKYLRGTIFSQNYEENGCLVKVKFRFFCWPRILFILPVPLIFSTSILRYTLLELPQKRRPCTIFQVPVFRFRVPVPCSLPMFKKLDEPCSAWDRHTIPPDRAHIQMKTQIILTIHNFLSHLLPSPLAVKNNFSNALFTNFSILWSRKGKKEKKIILLQVHVAGKKNNNKKRTLPLLLLDK